MTTVISPGGIVPERWTALADEELPGDAEHIIVSLHRLLQDTTLVASNQFKIGLDLEASMPLDDLAEVLPCLDLIVLHFEGFADGRAYSQAKLLRERFQFSGEIRAQGEVLRDQLSFMQRCGFTQFEIGDEEEVEMALDAFADFSFTYQPELKLAAQI
ncbi:MAG: DUF934 domain-containing protein [Pseudomonadota bacterium]